jgi:hypothetical protein
MPSFLPRGLELKRGVIFMPVAPASAVLPRPAGDDDEATHLVLEAVGTLHLAAFVTRHGPAPQEVAYELVRQGPVGAVRPAYMVARQGPASAASSAWISAAAHGLATWTEAGWSDPVVHRPGPLGLDHWWTAPLRGRRQRTRLMRLRARGRRRELENLVAHLRRRSASDRVDAGSLLAAHSGHTAVGGGGEGGERYALAGADAPRPEALDPRHERHRHHRPGRRPADQQHGQRPRQPAQHRHRPREPALQRTGRRRHPQLWRPPSCPATAPA